MILNNNCYSLSLCLFWLRLYTFITNCRGRRLQKKIQLRIFLIQFYIYIFLIKSKTKQKYNTIGTIPKSNRNVQSVFGDLWLLNCLNWGIIHWNPFFNGSLTVLPQEKIQHSFRFHQFVWFWIVAFSPLSTCRKTQSTQDGGVIQVKKLTAHVNNTQSRCNDKTQNIQFARDT